MYKLFTSYIDCGPPAIDRGSASAPNGTLYGSVANVTCNDGYNFTGTAQSFICMNSGWAGDVKCGEVGGYN